MGILFAFYTALSIFGLGVTVIDFLGLPDHAGGDMDTPAPDGGGDGGATGDHADGGFRYGEAGALLGSGNTGIRFITRLTALMRAAVYFSLGAGPTGLFALFTGRSALSGLIWAGAAGIGIAVLGGALRKLIRNDIDSSIKPEEMLMEKAIISVPVSRGRLGKAIVRQFGREQEVYVRGKDKNASFAKGCEVRIVDYDESQFWIE
jgi:hypothetical protein